MSKPKSPDLTTAIEAAEKLATDPNRPSCDVCGEAMRLNSILAKRIKGRDYWRVTWACTHWHPHVLFDIPIGAPT